MSDEPDWLINFDITSNDLRRLEEWLDEYNRGVTLADLTRRIIRGRLRFGRDESPSALPDWVREKHVLSWDEEEKWEVGSRVFVLRSLWQQHGISRQIIPSFGVIRNINKMANEETFVIEIENGERINYGRVKPGSPEAKQRFDFLRGEVLKSEQAMERASDQITLDQKVQNLFLQKGAQIASVILGALKQDLRFTTWNEYWYLQIWVHDIPEDTLRQVHRQLLKTTKTATMSQLRTQIPGLPDGEIGELSLERALSKVPDLFQPKEEGWQVIQPLPIPWEKAVGAYYVYDPQTYEILLKPGEPLKKKVAERLIALDLYTEVVRSKD